MAYILRSAVPSASPGSIVDPQIVVPQEIVDAVIDEIQKDENRTQLLTTCALISKAFHESACRHLFAKVEIFYNHSELPDWELRMGKLREALEANPKCASYIRCLKIITCLLHRNYNATRLSMFYVDQKSKLAETGRRLGLIHHSKRKNSNWVLQRLLSTANMATLEICGYESGFIMECSASWTRFPREIAALFLKVAQSNPHLRCLTLSDVMDIPISILARKNGNTFDGLQLDNCTFLSSDSGSQISLNPIGILTSQPPLIDFRTLHNLHLPDFPSASETPMTDTMVSAISHLPMLRSASLKMRGERYEADMLKQLLTSNAPLFKQLTIWLEPFHFKPEPHSNTSLDSGSLITPSEVSNDNLVALEEIVFLVYHPHHLVQTATNIQSMSQAISIFFEYPILATTIQKIKIDIYVQTERNVFVWQMDGTLLPETDAATALGFKDAMRSVDNVLCNRARFPRLQEVIVNIYVWKGNCTGSWCDGMLNCNADLDSFPRLSSNGVVIKLDVWSRDS